MDIIKILEKINCTDFEARTFLALLEESKGASVLGLSKKLNLPRPTIYGHIESLIEKGLAKKGVGETGAVFYAEDKENILSIYNEKIEEMKKARENFSEAFKNKDYGATYQPKLIHYSTKDAAKSILRDILRSREKETYWFWPLKEMLKVIPEEVLQNFNEERVRRKIWTNILWPPKRKIDIKKYPLLGPWNEKESLRRIKILPENIDQTLGYAIYGDKVAFISSDRENYGMIIDSRELAQTLKAQFDYFWKISRLIKQESV
ncbi:MAG: helix-turn-helix domain-containing protein [Candidatus Moraniibacteriota bacterium]